MKKTQKMSSYLRDNKTFVIAVLGVLTVILLLLFVTTKTNGVSTMNSEPSLAQNQYPIKDSDVQGVQSDNSRDDTSTTTTATNIGEAAESQDINQDDNQPEPVEPEPQDLSSVQVQAEAAIVWDTETGTSLYEKNVDTEMPLASITKLMTALVAAESVNNPDEQEVIITREHLEAYGTSGLVAGQTWNIQDLISFMLMSSANDAARAVAAHSSEEKADGYYAKAFIEEMNNKARELDLESTYFFNPSGLDLNETLISGGYGNARDVARLFGYILQTNQGILEPTTVSSRVFQSNEGATYSSQNTNTQLSRFSNILGSKTGYTVLAGGNLVMGFDLENPVVIVVLGSTRHGRFTDMEKLYHATIQHFNQQKTTNEIGIN
ncbi:MAG: serine hydrolase [Candidatus Paceibacterota bacterium]